MLPETDIDIITYAYYDSPVGVLKIGGTEQYITEISFAAKETEPAHNNTEPRPCYMHAQNNSSNTF